MSADPKPVSTPSTPSNHARADGGCDSVTNSAHRQQRPWGGEAWGLCAFRPDPMWSEVSGILCLRGAEGPVCSAWPALRRLPQETHAECAAGAHGVGAGIFAGAYQLGGRSKPALQQEESCGAEGLRPMLSLPCSLPDESEPRLSLNLKRADCFRARAGFHQPRFHPDIKYRLRRSAASESRKLARHTKVACALASIRTRSVRIGEPGPFPGPGPLSTGHPGGGGLRARPGLSTHAGVCAGGR